MTTTETGWNGNFSLTLQSNVRYALEEFGELDGFMATESYRDAPGYVRIALMAAWGRAQKSLELHRGCIADWCAPWFDGSAFPELPLCPKCGAEDSMEHHRVRVPDAPLDADWDVCSVCDYKTDPE